MIKTAIRALIIGIFFVCIAASTPLRMDGSTSAAGRWPRQVFAHYMMCCPRAGPAATLADFRQDIEDAAAAGIDGFALNIGDWKVNQRYKAFTELMFRAAEGFGPRFRLFFSADQLSAEDSADMLLAYANRPNYLRMAGRPVLSSFAGDAEWGRSLRKIVRERANSELFLVPFYFAPSRREPPTLVDIAAMAWMHRDLDGFFAFGTAAPYDALARTIQREAKAWHANGQLFMAGIAPYYRGLLHNFRVFESDGYVGFVEQWRAAIDSGADWAQLVTWNDWGESTYLAPIAQGDAAIVDANQWGMLPTHRGFLALSRFMSSWFKTGRQPSIEQEQVFLAYRLHPADAEGDRTPPKREMARPDGVAALTDRVSVLTLLREPATAIVRIGGAVTRQDMPAGLATMFAPLRPGSVEVTVERGGKAIGGLAGKLPVTTDGAIGNFNIYADSGPLSPSRR